MPFYPDIHTMASYFEMGGMVMLPLVLVALVLWYALIWRLLLMRSSRYGARQLLAQARKQQVKSKSVSAQASVWAMALAESDITRDHLKSLINEKFNGIKTELNHYKSLVLSLVTIAPLLGLLGTVDGMIETFNALGDMALFTQSGGIASGISRALFTTQMGLAISIPGIMLGRIIDRKQRHIGMELDQIRDQVCVSKD